MSSRMREQAARGGAHERDRAWTRLLVALLAAACVATLAGPARSGVANPDPRNSIVPSHVIVVACGVAGADSATGHVRVQCLDLIDNPIANARIVFDFSRCTDLRLADDQQDPRLLAICQLRSVSAFTDFAGFASFTILGSATDGPPSPPGALHIYADGVRVGTASVAVLDRDGVDGLTGADLSKWAADFFGGSHPPRADFDGDGEVGLADLSIWAGAYFGGRDARSAGPWCP